MARVLVLGAYGLIGREVTEALLAAGHAVRGLGRSEGAARRAFPDLDWHFADLRDMQSAGDWASALEGCAAAVNCAGALQDGPSDDLAAVHERAIAALADACAKADVRLVQISSVGVDAGAASPFLATKARGDAAIRSAGCDYVILRPGLVIAQEAYGGTALLRMLAAMPLLQVQALGDVELQTVAASDVAGAVRAAVEGALPERFESDLVAEEAHRLADVIAKVRGWLGFAAPRVRVNLPMWMTRAVGAGADALGRLGWRGPLRSTALEALDVGVRGDAAAWRAAGMPRLLSLDETLKGLRAGSLERLGARMALLMPLAVGVLALFWALSGLIGLLRIGAAADVLVQAGWGAGLAKLSVAFWALVDLALAGLILWRKTARLACLLMLGVSLLYLVMGTIITPWLWADPLGPLVKILPAAMLAAVTAALVSTR